MITVIKIFREKFILLLMGAMLTILVASCNKRDYPCPGLGKSEEADLSMFDEDGKLKDDKNRGRVDKSTGLIKKKKPKKLTAKRRTHI